MKKKVLGLLMAAVLCLCLLPVGAAVDGDVTVKYDGVDEASGNIKRSGGGSRNGTVLTASDTDVTLSSGQFYIVQDNVTISGDPHRRHQVFHLRADAAEYRSEMVWLILRLMLGSLYAIVYGAVNLTVPLPPMSLVTFDAPAFLLGVAILLGLELLRGRMEAGPAAGKERIAHEH